MSNKKTLQNYNAHLSNNTLKLEDILEMITNLPEAGEPTSPSVEPEYIQDGLIAWWEGCDPMTDNGHWNSRVGTDYIYPYGTSAYDIDGFWNSPETIKSPDAYRNNMVYSFRTYNDYHIQGYTFEVVGKINTIHTSAKPGSTLGTNTGGTLLALNRSLSPMIQIYESKQTFCVFNSKAVDNLTKKYTNCVGKRYKYAISLDKLPSRENVSTANEHQVSYSLNGDNWSTNTASSVSASSKGSFLTILTYYMDDYIANGEINSIRIYNRKLTHEELQHNYEIDKVRFNLDEYGS